MYNRFGNVFDEGLSSGKSIDNLFVEIPAMLKLVKGVRPKGKQLLDLGCGGGMQARRYIQLGAIVTGIDVSQPLLEIARKRAPKATFLQMDMRRLSFPKNSFDIVTSSLAMHYVPWKKLVKQVHKVLKKNGHFIVSTTHPWDDARRRIFEHGKKYSVAGRIVDLRTGKQRVVGNYFSEGVTEADWGHGGFKVRWYHQTMQSIIQNALKNGFRLEDLIEPKPLHSAKKRDKRRYDYMKKFPVMILFKFKKE